MVIGIDASRAFEEPRTGVGEYAFELITAFTKNSELLKDHEVVLFVRGDSPAFSLPPNWRIRVVANTPFLWTQRALARAAAAEKIDLLFSPSTALPLSVTCRTVYVFHGAEIKETPQSYSWRSRIIDGFLIRKSLKKADAVIAVSSTSAAAAVKHYGADKKKITVVHQGVNVETGDTTSAETDAKSCRLFGGRPYILYLGAFDLRKNIPGLIHAFSILRGRILQKEKDGKDKTEDPKQQGAQSPILVLVGSPGNASAMVVGAMASSPFTKDIHCAGHVSPKEKRRLIAGAACLAAPSLSEGFGRTVLEALCYGLPVVIADIPVFRELYGEYRELVTFSNPRDPRKMAQDIAKALIPPDPETALARAAESGTIRDKYNWNSAAAKVAEVIDKNK